MGEVERAELSRGALSVLMSTCTNRQGAVPQAWAGDEVWAELEEAGMVGPGRGLTRAGSIARQRERDRLLDDLFPLESRCAGEEDPNKKEDVGNDST